MQPEPSKDVIQTIVFILVKILIGYNASPLKRLFLAF